VFPGVYVREALNPFFPIKVLHSIEVLHPNGPDLVADALEKAYDVICRLAQHFEKRTMDFAENLRALFAPTSRTCIPAWAIWLKKLTSPATWGLFFSSSWNSLES
jgi:hypothetical protein